jgi:putative spermidine/putrescine transport system permease protein
MIAGPRIVERLVFALVALVVAIQLAPLVVVALVSVSSSPVFDITAGSWSLRWWERLMNARGFWSATAVSAELAALATAIALVLGTLAAIAIARGRFPGREALSAFILSPLMLPGLVIGIAMLRGYPRYGLTNAFAALLVAHVVITLPFVVRMVLSSLSLFDFTLIDAARTLGCSFPLALWRVLVPNLMPAFLTSSVFAFLASFDNYPISIFLTDAHTKTLPAQMLEFLDESANPMIAAISTVLLLLAMAALLAIHRLIGLRRAVSF